MRLETVSARVSHMHCQATNTCTGILDPAEAIAPLLSSTPKTATVHRHFSAFPLTSHMHTPTLRLVSLHPLLSLSLTFARVPEIDEDFTWKMFITRGTTVEEVVEAVGAELGIARVIYGPGGGSVDYVLEEVWNDINGSESLSSYPLNHPFD
jgi:diaphanous 1